MLKMDWESLGFAINPAEKMFVAEYRNEKWDQGQIVDYAPLSLYPSAVVLNYGQGVFEGMKAHRMADGKIVMFRPLENARRLNDGCRRLCMPELEESFFVRNIAELVKQNSDFVPPNGKGDLYIRPLLFGAGEMLGVSPAQDYMFVVFMSPVGPYYKSGFKGIKLQIRDDFHRSPMFGTGGIKAIGNYASSLLPKRLANDKGFDEVVYLDARLSAYVEEVGSSNFFMLSDGVVSTPRLSGSVLPGITRDAVLSLCREKLELRIQERDIRWSELFDADELFCTGTATVVTPIVSVSYGDESQELSGGKPGEITTSLFNMFNRIMSGEASDDFDWLYTV